MAYGLLNTLNEVMYKVVHSGTLNGHNDVLTTILLTPYIQVLRDPQYHTFTTSLCTNMYTVLEPIGVYGGYGVCTVWDM